MASEQFSTITNMIAARSVQMGGWPWTNYTLDLAQQKQINSMALDVAKELYDPNPNDSSMRARALYGLSREGLITDPQIIPHLIKALKTTRGRNTYGIRKDMAGALSFMTARMMGMVCWSAPDYSLEPDTKEFDQVVSWWEGWWDSNKDKHPVFDRIQYGKIRVACCEIEGVIQKELGPKHPELALFTAETNRPFGTKFGRMFEHQYEPYYISRPIYFPSNGAPQIGKNGSMPIPYNELPWLEVASRFEYPEMQTEWERMKAKQPPKHLQGFLTSVYSNKVEGTDIYIEVRVASPNKDFIDDLRKALAERK